MKMYSRGWCNQPVLTSSVGFSQQNQRRNRGCCSQPKETWIALTKRWGPNKYLENYLLGIKQWQCPLGTAFPARCQEFRSNCNLDADDVGWWRAPQQNFLNRRSWDGQKFISTSWSANLSNIGAAKTWEIHGSLGTWCSKPSKLVGGLNPSEKYESQLGSLFPIYGKIKNVPKHQPSNVGRSWEHLLQSIGFDNAFFEVTRPDPIITSSRHPQLWEAEVEGS